MNDNEIKIRNGSLVMRKDESIIWLIVNDNLSTNFMSVFDLNDPDDNSKKTSEIQDIEIEKNWILVRLKCKEWVVLSY